MSIKIGKKIVGYGVVQPEAEAEKPRSSGAKVIQMHEKLERPDTLRGTTYKIKPPVASHAMHITINDIVLNPGTEHEHYRPFEIFINSKNMEHYAWTVALTRMISAVFRRGGDVSFVVEELKAVFDPRGGYWIEGEYVPSLLAAIGDVIEKHLVSISFITNPGDTKEQAVALREAASMAANPGDKRMRSCPHCSQPSLMRLEGCDTCTSCGFSKCG